MASPRLKPFDDTESFSVISRHHINRINEVLQWHHNSPGTIYHYTTSSRPHDDTMFLSVPSWNHIWEILRRLPLSLGQNYEPLSLRWCHDQSLSWKDITLSLSFSLSFSQDVKYNGLTLAVYHRFEVWDKITASGMKVMTSHRLCSIGWTLHKAGSMSLSFLTWTIGPRSGFSVNFSTAAFCSCSNMIICCIQKKVERKIKWKHHNGKRERFFRLVIQALRGTKVSQF